MSKQKGSTLFQAEHYIKRSIDVLLSNAMTCVHSILRVSTTNTVQILFATIVCDCLLNFYSKSGKEEYK